MKAFFVHDAKKQADMMVVPEADRIVPVSRDSLDEFIAVKPDFSKFSGDPLNDLAPEALGVVVATREPEGDVCVVDLTLWQQRMASYMDGA